MLLNAALICLALNVYHESRGEMIPGQYAVALTTINRAKDQKKSVCEVVTAHHQFSWTNNLIVKTRRGYKCKKEALPTDEAAWKLAKTIARTVLSGRMHDFTRGAEYYHTKWITPNWSRSLAVTKVIGSHIFYKQW